MAAIDTPYSAVAAWSEAESTFDAIRSGFGRFPLIDEPSFRSRLTQAFGEQTRPIDPP